jgi:hypothetical protein
MKAMDMNDVWQVSQIFLSDTGVHEVSINMKTSRVRCNCPGYVARANCKHVRIVNQRMEKNGGVYPIEVSSRASRADTSMARRDPEMFRTFLAKYGRIEVV